MARKPNYRFERHERERTKAAKKAARAAAKADKKQADGEGEPDSVGQSSDDNQQPSAEEKHTAE